MTLENIAITIPTNTTGNSGTATYKLQPVRANQWCNVSILLNAVSQHPVSWALVSSGQTIANGKGVSGSLNPVLIPPGADIALTMTCDGGGAGDTFTGQISGVASFDKQEVVGAQMPPGTLIGGSVDTQSNNTLQGTITIPAGQTAGSLAFTCPAGMVACIAVPKGITGLHFTPVFTDKSGYVVPNSLGNNQYTTQMVFCDALSSSAITLAVSVTIDVQATAVNIDVVSSKAPSSSLDYQISQLRQNVVATQGSVGGVPSQTIVEIGGSDYVGAGRLNMVRVNATGSVAVIGPYASGGAIDSVNGPQWAGYDDGTGHMQGVVAGLKRLPITFDGVSQGALLFDSAGTGLKAVNSNDFSLANWLAGAIIPGVRGNQAVIANGGTIISNPGPTKQLLIFAIGACEAGAADDWAMNMVSGSFMFASVTGYNPGVVVFPNGLLAAAGTQLTYSAAHINQNLKITVAYTIISTLL